MRFSGLPIEYYDAAFLGFVGNRIGRTVKVDRNTLSQERGKYARICVEVDLAKPLLPVFEVKGKIYRVEYEGLHLLCLSCGKFGHYREGCPNKAPVECAEKETDTAVNGAPTEENIWTVVQKHRRGKKVRKKTLPTVTTVAGGERKLPRDLVLTH